MKITYNCIEYDFWVVQCNVIGLGGLEKIKERLDNEHMLFGMRHYLETIFNVATKFSELGYEFSID